MRLIGWLGIVLNYGMTMYWLVQISQGVTAFGIPRDMMGLLPIGHLAALLLSALSLDMQRAREQSEPPQTREDPAHD